MSHSNHAVIDQAMADDATSDDTSSLKRLTQVRKDVQAATSSSEGVTVADAKRILEKCPPAHPKIAPTIASCVMEPDSHMGSNAVRLHVRFADSDRWIQVGS